MKRSVRNMTSAAACLALCLVLPFLTGQIPNIGRMLSPMHLPVLLAGFVCGPWWAAVVGLCAPLLRHALFRMPPFPTAYGMCLELAAYGLVAGLLYRRLPRKPGYLYCALLGAMLAGRVVYGLAMWAILGAEYTWAAFVTGAFTGAIPGIILQIVLIPVIVLALEKTRLLDPERK